MATSINDSEKDQSTISILSIQNNVPRISLYLLWSSDIDDEFKIQAYFENSSTLDFKPLERFRNGQESETVLYQLEYTHIYNENNNSISDRYQLRMSTKKLTIPTVYNDSKQRRIHPDSPYQFLFDVHFENHILSSSKGSSVECWNQLCFYTYFLIRNNQENNFDYFIQQFTNELNINHKRKLTPSQLKMFFSICYIHLPLINSYLLTNSRTIKIFFRMFAILPIDKENFPIEYDLLNFLASELYDYIKRHINELLQTIDYEDWSSFIRGLTILMCVEMLGNQTTFDTFALLKQMTNYRDKHQVTVNVLLQRLVELQMPIKKNNWINLFPLAVHNHLLYKSLELVATFDDYLIVLQTIIRCKHPEQQMRLQLTNNFDTFISRVDLTISLANILNLLTYLQPQDSTTSSSSTEDMLIFSQIIKSSVLLRQKITTCLDHLDIHEIHFESLHQLFHLDHNVSIIDTDKRTFLIRIITNSSNRTEYFFTTWFTCFLCDYQYQITDDNRDNFIYLLNVWLSYVHHDRDIFYQIITKLDIFIDHLQAVLINNDDDDRLTHFIQTMLIECFQPDMVFQIIMNICTKITNKSFLNAYENKFRDDLVANNINRLKLMDDQTNPLYHLLELSKIIDPKNNPLLLHLITTCTELIHLTYEEIYDETFLHPTKTTCSYTVLFNQHLDDFRLYQEFVNHLHRLWNHWTSRLTRLDIETWRNYSTDEQNTFDQIWEYVQRHFNEPESINTIFQRIDLQYQEMIRISNAILSALKIYCQKAVDYTKAMISLQDMLQQFHGMPIQSVSIPNDVQNLEAIARRLYPFSESQLWLHFHNRNCLEIGVMSTDRKDHSRVSKILTSARHSQDNLTSMEMLNNVDSIFDKFQLTLVDICTNWKSQVIKNWIELFANIDDIHSELEILKSNLDLLVPLELIEILNLWQKRNFVSHVCQGCLNIITQLDIPVTKDDVNVFITLVKLDENILSDECSLAYRHYLHQYVLCYSSNVLIIWAQFSMASELIDFLLAASTTDFDHLLESINDWDEKVVSRNILYNFVTLKYYFNEVYKSIDLLRSNTHRYTLPDFLACFDHSQIINQFGNVQEFFEICLSELTNIKQSYSNLTDREQSKRRQMISIMRNTSIVFSQSIEFNVCLSPQRLNFSDLNELRDRARLIEYSCMTKMKNDHEHHITQLRSFIILVNTIETILNILTSLYIASYPIDLKRIISEQIFQCLDNQFDQLIHFNEKLREILTSWENTLCEKYIIYPELTYFSCKQFDLIEQFLENRSASDDEQHGYHLLKYIGLEPSLICPIDPSNSKQQTPNDRLIHLGEILKQQRHEPEKARIEKRILLLETTDDQILRGILSLFNHCQTVPMVNQLFYCTNETTWMEIRAFIYRCVYSDEFHLLIRPEYLSTSLQDQTIHLVKQFEEKQPQYLFQFGIITTIPISRLPLVDGLKSLQIVRTICEQDLLSNIDFTTTVSGLIKNCTIVTSSTTGLGKSYTIKEQCDKAKRIYIKFPINGDIQPDSIAERLVNEASRFRNGVIHFDVGAIENYDQINDLFNCLILFRRFRFGQIAVSIPVDTPIYIELDCSFHSSLLKRIILFQHISSIFIPSINWRTLSLTKSVQFVANYLKAIQEKTIIKKDITIDDMERLEVDECVKLIQYYFFHNPKSNYLTWTKVFIYISVYYNLFLGFFNCSYFKTEYLQNSRLRQSRMEILQALLASADQFTSISVAAVRAQQRAVNSNEPNNNLQQEISDVIIKWDRIQPFTLIFSSTYDLIFAYKTEKDIPQSLKNYFDLYNKKIHSSDEYRIVSGKTIFPDYKQLTHEQLFIQLTKLSMKYFNSGICTKCFRRYDLDCEFVTCENCFATIDCLERPYPSRSHEDTEAFQKRIAKIIETEYVLTADNYIKMLLIFLRVQSGVPVLIMGETGCGKTALINCLCRKILDDDFHVFRLHAGVTDENIISEMNRLIIQAHNLSSNKRLWILFDEFNTIFNISLLKEIICDRTLLGTTLPMNMVFLGTCNPRRVRSTKSIFDENVGIKLIHPRQHLLYTVTSIPETMLEYIWDYGYLDRETEKTYMAATLKTCQDLSNSPEWFQTIIELISESHAFLRELEDVSSVSLRDVTRYCRLYKWFHQYLTDRKDKLDVIKRSSLIALLLCYYFRLNSKENKRLYLQRLDNHCSHSIIKQLNLSLKTYLEKLLDDEETRLINQMQVPNDMAQNRALKDNLFVLFSCIINRIPVFLCGKPGASKTSAVQILMNNLKGLRSENIYFRKLPELISVTFQGSQNCTSKSIEQIFERAEKYLTIESQASLLPVIIFDEIGLAESSVYNPLKVLHVQLEMEECRFGFVGLSNWRLDASKMNRALYIACVDPDDEDLQLTSSSLSKMILYSNQVIQFNPNILRGLAQAYFDLLQRRNQEHKYKNYFGLRDYYSLIKGIVYHCQKYPQRSQYEIIYQQLVLNFDDITNGYDYIWEKVCTLLDRWDLINAFKIPTPKELIEQSLMNRHSRHLMLIVDQESRIDHVEHFITTNTLFNESVKILVGSYFQNDFISKDTYNESYLNRVVMDIILHAETPITLVMRRMNHLYDNLYDLFNQNFAIAARKKYCRIAFSSIYNPQCFVHDQFRCVILLNSKDIEQCHPSFLSRFEKHYIHIDKFIEMRQWSLTSQLLKWLLHLPISNVNQHFPLLKHLIIPYCPDYICNVVIEICQKENDLSDEEILNLCKEKLIRACSFDFPLVLSLNGNEHLIEQYYRIHTQLLNISQLIASTFEQSSSTKRIIYTYTSIYDTLNYKNPENIHEIKLSNMNTELDLINLLKTHHEHKRPSSLILIIRVDYHREYQHLLSLKYNILNQRNDFENCHLWIIFHIQRNKINQIIDDILFSSWDIIMMDDLHETNPRISKQILTNPSYGYFIDQYPLNYLAIFFNEFIHRTFAKFHYDDLSNDQQIQRNNHLVEILNNESDQFLRRTFQQTINILIRTIPNPDRTRFQDWRSDLIHNHSVIAMSQSFNQALQTIITLFYDSYFQLLFHHFQSFNLIDSYFHCQENDLKHFWIDCYELSLSTIDNSLMNVNLIEMPYIKHLKLPYSVREHQIVQQIRTIVQRRINEEGDENNLELFLTNLLRSTSSYGPILIDRILENTELLNLYYHDQLILFHDENKFQLSTIFLLKLLTTNTRRKTMRRLIELVAYPDKLMKIVRIFEDGCIILDENIFLKEMNRQMISIQSLEYTSNSFYSIVFQNESFHLIRPHSSDVHQTFEFHPDVDPFIEVSFMNLIELILSPKLIRERGDLEQITSIFSSINQSVVKLSDYEVINLGKLRSFMSFLRCIKRLNPSQALRIFQQCCTDEQFDGSFSTCVAIHEFIQRLERYIRQPQGCIADETSVKSILLKLEVEFLKNWLVDHDDQYADVLYIINRTDDQLWKYSAKIFSSIIRKLEFLSNDIEWSYNNLFEESIDISSFEVHLNTFWKSQYKIHRLLINRIYLDLISRLSLTTHSIKTYLDNYYDNFQNSIEYMMNLDIIHSSSEYFHIRLIRLLAWLKYYTQLYTFALINHMKFQHSNDINDYLMKNQSSFCSTLKLFVVKQILYVSQMDWKTFQQTDKYRTITWMNEFFEINLIENRSNLILPISLLESLDEYNDVNRILNDLIDSESLENLLFECSLNQYFAYCFYLCFIKYYTQYANTNFSSDNQYRDYLQTKLSNQSKIFLQPIGIAFLGMLCTNRSSNSYFHLTSSMSDREISLRVVILNIFALALSFKSFAKSNWLNSILFDVNFCMPMNYFEHLQSICLVDLINEKSILSTTKHVHDSLEQQSDHLTSTLSHRFLHLFIHSIVLVLRELNYLSDENLQQWNIHSDTYLQEYIAKDYQLIEKFIPESEYSYLWLFQVLNNILNDCIEPLGIPDSREKLLLIEKSIDAKLILPHGTSTDEEMNKYKQMYIDHRNADASFINFIEERRENTHRYPFLNVFNVTQIYHADLIDGYLTRLKIISHAQTNYPLTMYLLQDMERWRNIQYLYPIVQFLNYLRDKYNYRTSRRQAESKSIRECLNDQKDAKGDELYQQFSDAWSKINLKEVHYNSQVRTFDRKVDKERKLSFFSLNISSNHPDLLLSATLQTLAQLQNDIVHYFHHQVMNSTNSCSLPIDRIEREHLFQFDSHFINLKILNNALVIPFEYGQGKDVIYDYEEIELTLRSLVNRLPLLNIDQFRKIQYQFEMFTENNSLINDVRQHVGQISINDHQRRQYRCVLQTKDDNDILQYLSSLDCIFTYIQHRNYRSTISTIRLFVHEYIPVQSFLDQNQFLESSFSSLKLEYIIDLYELIEEIAFDKVVRNYIEEKLNDQSIEDNQRKVLQEKFLSMTIDNKHIASNLQNIDYWISTLKRFMVRILPDHVDLNIPIEMYLKQTDLWNSPICKEDIATIQIDESILLKHTFVILIGLENRLKETDEHTQPTVAIEIRNSRKERQEASSFEKSVSPKTISSSQSRRKIHQRMRGD